MNRRAPGVPGAVELIEEAVHLLRGLPAGTLALYYMGAIPWTVGFLYFWACASWFAPTGARLAWTALGLTGLYAWLKCTQAEFGARLLARRAGLPAPVLSPRRLAGTLLTQVRWQSWGLLALLASAGLVVPVAWVFAFCQNLSVLATPDDETPALGAAAAAQAALWPGQNFRGLALIAGLAVCVAVNVAQFFYLLPAMAHTLLGMDNLFSRDGIALFNTTFLAAVGALTWLAVDPLVKAFYVLRVFHGRSLRTGADLRGELAAARARPVGTAVLLLGLCSVLLGPAAPRLAAAGTAPPSGVAAPAAVAPATLDRAIGEALQQDDFQWRLRPPPAPPDAAKGNWLKAFIDDGLKWLGDTFSSVVDWIWRIIQWFRGGETPVKAPSASGGTGMLTGLLYAMIAVGVALLLVVGWTLWRRSRGPEAQVSLARAVAAVPDLRDENVQAALLPADGWLALARQQLAAGEWRLALRALYLATLARLAAEGLLTLVRSKTNLDYERELIRRAPARAGVVEEFGRRRREFEEVWYGPEQAGPAQVRAWLAALEGRPPP